MQISITTNHHYYEASFFDEDTLWQKFNLKYKKDKKNIENTLFSSVYELTTKNKDFSQLQIIGFKNQRNILNEEAQLVLKLFSQEYFEKKRFAIQTGLFAGVIHHKGYTFNIETRYGNVLLHRMLNFVNNIYVDTKDVNAKLQKKTNEFQYIISYLFIQSLEKASVLGLPKQYRSVTQRSAKVRGKININEYLKRDIPFKGKLTSTYRTQKYIQEIIDVLFAATHKVEEYLGSHYKSKIIGIYQTLNEYSSKKYVSQLVINKAKNHIVLKNPLYGAFNEVLNYAEILIKNQAIEEDSISKQLKTYGFLFDISQLFEVYLEKLLSRHFKDWTINGQEELKVYNRQFFGRRMYPDIIMRNKYSQEIIVFDAKFKKMKGRKQDLDRSDFYQIHTYMQYYIPNVIFGGLIYPLSKELSEVKSISNGLFDEQQFTPNFIVDGIYVNQQMDSETLIKSEQEFLNRIEAQIKNYRIMRQQKVS